MKIQIIKKKQLLSIPEFVFLFLLIPIICLLSARYSVGPRHWDDILYVHTAWNNEALPWILNRYFGVFLLQLFIFLAGKDPFMGSRLLGGFVFAISLILIYICSKIIARKQRSLVAFFSVALMSAYSVFIDDFGIVMADYVLTMMMLFGVLIFLLFWEYPEKRLLLLVVFGFTTFLAFKTKETGIFLLALAPAFLMETEHKLEFKTVLIELAHLFVGILVGIVIFMLLDAIRLNDVFFSLRSSNIKTLLSFNTRQFNVIQEENNNFWYSLAPGVCLIFTLVWFFTTKNEKKSHLRWLLVLVFGIVVFLNISLVNGGWITVPWYLTFVIGVLSILAPQIISDFVPDDFRTWPKGVFIISGACMLACLLILLIFYVFSKPSGITFDYFLAGIIIPNSLIILLGCFCLHSKKSLLSYSLILIGFFILSIPLAAKKIDNYYSFFTTRIDRFLPFEDFKDLLSCDENTVLISSNSFINDGYLSRDQKSSQQVYNLFFRCHKPLDQFSSASSPEELYRMLLQNNYDEVFLTKEDWGFLEDQPKFLTKIQAHYQVHQDPDNGFILLSGR